jgi:hypothetical protein
VTYVIRDGTLVEGGGRSESRYASKEPSQWPTNLAATIVGSQSHSKHCFFVTVALVVLCMHGFRMQTGHAEIVIILAG